MPARPSPVDQSIEQVVDRILNSRKITRTDQQTLMSALMSKNMLTTKEQLLINQVFDTLRKGMLRVVD